MQEYEALMVQKARHQNDIATQKHEKSILDDRASLVGCLFASGIGGFETASLYDVASTQEVEQFSLSYQMEVK